MSEGGPSTDRREEAFTIPLLHCNRIRGKGKFATNM